MVRQYIGAVLQIQNLSIEFTVRLFNAHFGCANAPTVAVMQKFPMQSSVESNEYNEKPFIQRVYHVHRTIAPKTP